ncbi:MAG: hypothetical protein E7238_07305 [Sarcina sp.]|nr:hypothetical protein [Sarcina sp.]
MVENIHEICRTFCSFMKQAGLLRTAADRFSGPAGDWEKGLRNARLSYARQNLLLLLLFFYRRGGKMFCDAYKSGAIKTAPPVWGAGHCEIEFQTVWITDPHGLVLFFIAQYRDFSRGIRAQKRGTRFIVGTILR